MQLQHFNGYNVIASSGVKIKMGTRMKSQQFLSYASPIIVFEDVVSCQDDKGWAVFWGPLQQVEKPLNSTGAHRHLATLESALHDVHHALTQR